jgi:hypothetical protein
MVDFSVASVAERLDATLRGMDNRQAAALLKERADYETSHESVRRARKGLMQSIPHEMVAAVALAFGADAGWLLTGEEHGEGAQVAPSDPPEDEWTRFSLEMVRMAGGSAPMSEAERQLVRRDVLEGIVRLGSAEGRDVRRFEEQLRQIEAAALPAAPIGESTLDRVLRYVELEAMIADKRTDALKDIAAASKDIAAASRMEVEETRARRLSMEVSARDLAIARQGVEAVRIAEEQEHRGRESAPPDGPGSRPPPRERPPVDQ